MPKKQSSIFVQVTHQIASLNFLKTFYVLSIICATEPLETNVTKYRVVRLFRDYAPFLENSALFEVYFMKEMQAW